MNIEKVIRDEVVCRASAARDLMNGIRINDISIVGGCYADGIQVYSGIEEIARIMGEELKEDVFTSGDFVVCEQWFTYGTDDTDAVKFFQRDYKRVDTVKAKPKEDRSWDR